MKIFNFNKNNTNDNEVVEEEVEKENTENKVEEVAPKKESKLKKSIRRMKMLFFIWNILSLAVYTTVALFNVYKQTKSTIFSSIIIVCLIIYAITFVALIAVDRKNEKHLKSELKNYKSSIKILKSVVKLLNIGLSISVAVSVLSSSGIFGNIATIGIGIFTIFTTVMSILFEILKILKRKKKQRKLEEKQKRLNQ